MKVKPEDLVVKRSQLKGAGKGLYTKVEIPRGTRIVEYKGEVKTWEDVKDDNGRNRYLMYINMKNVIDAEKDKTALARYANDAKGTIKNSEFKNNSSYIIYGKKAFIVSKRKIYAGEEIFVGYGKDYWDTIH